MKLMKLIAALMVLLGCGVSYAQSTTGAVSGFCVSGATSAVVSGLPSTNKLQGIIPSCQVTVYLSGTTTKATIFANPSSGSLGNPFTATNTGQWLFYAAQAGSYDVVLTGGFPPNVYTSPVTLTGLIAEGGGGGGGGGAAITINGGSTLASPVNFANSSGNGQINFTNPSASNVQATLATPFSIINGVNCPLGSAGCALPPFCAGPTCANLDQNNPTFTTVLVTTTASITSTSLTIPVASTTGWPATGCGWTNGAVEFICWDSITPTSLVLNQLSLRRGGNAYTAVSHPINTNIEGAVYTQAASTTSPQNFQVSSTGQGGLFNGINPGVAFQTSFGGTVYMPDLLAAEGGIYAPNGIAFQPGGGNFVNSRSSATSQFVTCNPVGTPSGKFCNDEGNWVVGGGGGGFTLTPGFLPYAATSSTLGDSPIDNAITNFGVLTSALPMYVNPTDGNDQTSFVISGEVTGQNSSIFDVNTFNGIQLLSVTGDGTINPGWVNAFIGLELGNRNDGLAYLPNSVCADNYGAVTYDSIGCINFLGANGSGPNGIAINAVIQGSGVGGNPPQITFGISSSSTTATTIATIDQTGLELNYLTPSTNALCYLPGSTAVISNVGCSAGLSGLTLGFIPIATSSSTIGNSLLDYNITNAGDFTFGAPAMLQSGSEMNGSAICTTATGCGSAALTLTTTGTSGAATFLSGVLNVPVYVAPTGQYLALAPALGTPQFVVTQPGDSTTFLQTSVGNVGVVEPNVISMFSYGQGWNCGNNSTACGNSPAWSTQNGLTLNAYSATRGIMQGMLLNCDKNAAGDFACIYGYPECYGGYVDASGEGCQGMTLQMTQSPWFNGALVTPSVGTLSGAHGPSTAGLTYIWVGGNGAPVTFPTGGSVVSFSVTYTANTTAQTIDIGLATPNGFGSFTLGAPVTESLPSLTCSSGSPCVETWTPSLTPTAGQTIYYYQATGNAPANGSFTGAAFSGVPSAGTFTTSASAGMLMTAVLAAPANGANSITLGSLNCNVNCTNPRIGSNIADDSIVINTTEATSAVTLGAESTIMNGISYALTAGTVPVSVAWGNIIGSSCTGNGSGHYQAYVATTCTVTLGVSPATPNHFVVSGGITSCPVVAASPGTSLDANLSGPFKEEVYITAVTTGSTTDSVTFCTRNAWNNGNSTRIMQGGPVSEAMVSNAAISAGWPVGYKIDGAFTSTQLAISNCVGGGVGACNNGSTGNLLPSGTAVTIYSAAITTGTGNGAVATNTLGTNDMLLTVADNIVGTPASEVSMEGIRLVCGQWTPIDGGAPSSCLQLADSGGSRMLAMIRLGNSGSSGAPGPTMIDADTGFWADTLKLANAPTSYLIEMQNHSQTTNGIVKYDDSFGALSFIDTGSLFNQEVLNWTETFNAFAYEANGNLGTSGQFLTSGGTSGAAGWTTMPWASPPPIGNTTPNTGAFTNLTATSLSTGSAPPANCGSATGCVSGSQSSATDTPTVATWDIWMNSSGKMMNSVGTTSQFLGTPPLQGTTGTLTSTLLSASCVVGTATVTGAVVGHTVGISSTTGSDVGGAFNVRASVTSTNTVSVYLCGTGTSPALAFNVTTY